MKTTMKRMIKQNKQSACTLIELLIVMAILALLAGLVGPTLWSKLSGAKRDVAATQIKSLESALDSYRLDMGKYPKDLKELTSDSTGKSAWDGPYIKRLPKDPWESDYLYTSPGKHNKDFDLSSMGADGREGGAEDDADIANW